MAVSLTELQSTISSLLRTEQFKDYAPNGLQVEGKPTIEKIVSGVTASRAFIEAAIDAGADALLVHHGYFWRGEEQTIVGIKRKRIELLLNNQISLLAYHLPLDAHAELGNNVQLGGASDSSRPERWAGTVITL
jgi:putative NIF3 family GTP cyclohydrolase 1 type 2